MNKIYISLGIVLVIIAGYFAYKNFNTGIFSNSGPGVDPKLEEFAKCVADTGITMYGAYWCPHCKSEKERFGEYFKYINYVECTQNPNLCIEKEVKGYPTWITKEGTKYEGELGLERIAEITKCSI